MSDQISNGFPERPGGLSRLLIRAAKPKGERLQVVLRSASSTTQDARRSIEPLIIDLWILIGAVYRSPPHRHKSLQQPQQFEMTLVFSHKSRELSPSLSGLPQMKAVSMKHESNVVNERRKRRRFCVHASVSLNIDDVPLTGLTRDMSSEGVYVYLCSVEDIALHQILELIIELPPEITLSSSSCMIRCSGRVVRVIDEPTDLTGIAVEIQSYTISRSSGGGISPAKSCKDQERNAPRDVS